MSYTQDERAGTGGQEEPVTADGTIQVEDLIFFLFLLLFIFFQLTINIQGLVSTLPLKMEFLSLDSCYKIKSLFIQLHE